MEKDGGWLFISHSHKDIDIVRKIRNLFEEHGFEPLMFYLKCLSDKDEVESLIKREINEREWFIYVDSPNSEKSHWVQTERDYIATLSGKKIFTIHIDKNIEAQVDHITRQLKVFISYSHSDRRIYNLLKNALLNKDYLVLDDQNFTISDDLLTQVGSAIMDSARNGFVILLIGEKTKNSCFIKKEIELAKQNDAKIVPVYIGNASLDYELLSLIGENQGVHIDSTPTKEQIEEIVSQIEHHISYYYSDYKYSVGFQNAEIIHYPYVATIPDYTFCDCDKLKILHIPSCVVEISDKAFLPNQDILIICQKGSYAEDYCKKHGFRYKISDDEK